MTKRNIIVVGNGLFGSIAAEYARSCGHTVTVISEERKYAASPAAGCVLAPSWLSSLSKGEIADSMELLNDLYGLIPVEFTTNLFKKFKAHRVDPAKVLCKPDIEAQVLSVADGIVKYAEPHSAGTQKVGTLRGTVLVAAGIWSQELITGMPPIRGLYGASLRVSGQLNEPQINVYAPYRQAVGFNIDKKNVWFGDGTTLIQSTWNKEEVNRVGATIERAKDMVGGHPKVKVTMGARPFVDGHKGGYLQQVSPKLWVSTGGGKNGIALAALQALRFVEAL